MGQIEKRGVNTYRLVVSCGVDSTKKRQKKYKTIKLPLNMTEKQVQLELSAQLSRFEKEIQKGTYLDGNITLNEFADKWLKDYAEINLRPKTLIFYKKLLKRVLIALGHKKLDGIQPNHLMEFYRNLGESGIRLDYMYRLKEDVLKQMPDLEKKAATAKINSKTIKQILRGRNTNRTVADKICSALDIPLSKLFEAANKEKKLSSTTIHHHHKLISTMLNTAVQWQLIMSNPAERVKPPRIERTEAKYYDVDEVNQMLVLLESEPIKYRAMIYIVIFCGLRLGELAALEWSDINFDDETITISKQLQYIPEFGTFETNRAKTDSGNRTISFPSILADLLREYKAWQDEEKVNWGDKWIESNKLFTKENGDAIFPDTPSKWFMKFIKRNNLPPLTFHQIRHTHISLLISQKIDVATVSKRAGHSSPGITLKIYTHALKQQDREAADTLGNLIKKKK